MGGGVDESPRIAARRVGRRGWLAGLGAAAAVTALPRGAAPALAPATLPAPIGDAIRFFDTIALVNQDGDAPPSPGWVRKWRGPVAVRLSGAAHSPLKDELEAALADLSRWTRLPFRLSADSVGTGNLLTVAVKPHAEIVAGSGSGGNVCTCSTYGHGGRLHTGYVEISDHWVDCLNHELMHAVGFDNHWHGGGNGRLLRTTLAPRFSPSRATRFTPWDALAIRALYDPQFEPRMPRHRALPVARRVIASLMSLTPA